MKEDIIKFIKGNGLEKEKDLLAYPEIFKSYCKLSEKDKDELFPESRKNSKSKYKFLKTFEDLKHFIEINDIKSRNELLKDYSGAGRFFSRLSEEEKNSLMPYRGINLSVPLKTEEDFKRFIKENNIVSKIDFRRRYNNHIFSDFNKLPKEIKDRLLPPIFEDWSNIKSFDGMKAFLSEKNITSRGELCTIISAYRIFLQFTEEEKDKLLPRLVNDWTNLNTLDDFQKYIEDNNVQSYSDFVRNHNSVYERFRQLTFTDKKERDLLVFREDSRIKSHSYGERYLMDLLGDNGLDFVTEKIFSDLKRAGYLRFDFYLPKLNILLEYHGEQHFYYSRESLYCSEELRENDIIKYEYAKKSGMHILYFTLETRYYNKFGYFAPVITDPNVLIDEIKRIAGLTN